MKYEIITDKDDLLVLTLNSRVILVSRNITEVLAAIEKDYPHHLNKKKRAPYKEADIKLQAVAIRAKRITKTTRSNAGSLGRLFNLE